MSVAPPAAAAAPDPRRVARNREMLLIALVVGVAAPLLRVHPDQRVGASWSAGLLLPPLCFSRQWFGVNCPGCGLTRSLVHLAHGDWGESWRCHRLGWLLAGLVVLQVPYRGLELLRPHRRLLSPARARWVSRSLIALLLLNWFVGFWLPA
jgi:uncharacterized protein DUF2752